MPDVFIPMMEFYYSQIKDESLIGYMRGMANRQDFTDKIKSWTIPIGLYHGKEDQLIDQYHFYKIAALPNVCNISLDSQSGHMAMLENPVHCFYQILYFSDWLYR